MHYYNSITIKQAPLFLLLIIAEDLLTHTKCSNGNRFSVPKCQFGTFGCQLLRLKIVQFEPTPIGSVHPCFTRTRKSLWTLPACHFHPRLFSLWFVFVFWRRGMLKSKHVANTMLIKWSAVCPIVVVLLLHLSLITIPIDTSKPTTVTTIISAAVAKFVAA